MPLRAIPQARPAVRWVFCYYARECIPRSIDRRICPRQIRRSMVWEVIRPISKKPEASAGRACGIQSHSQDEPEWGGIKESLLPLRGATMRREPKSLKSTPFPHAPDWQQYADKAQQDKRTVHREHRPKVKPRGSARRWLLRVSRAHCRGCPMRIAC
jgi:hypothetical protein